MTTREYFQRRRELRLAWNALTMAADVAEPPRALDAVRDALCWLAASEGAQASPSSATAWVAVSGPPAGVQEGDLTVLRTVLRKGGPGVDQESAATQLRDALPSVWRLLETERYQLSRSCPATVTAILAMRTVVSVCLLLAVAWGTTEGVTRARQIVRPDGFWVTYYADADLKKRRGSRIEPVVSKDYGGRPPLLTMRSGTWSSRWETRLKVKESADYFFVTKSQDGVRLYIDDRVVIDNWLGRDWGTSLRKGVCPLEEGTHTVRVEHVVYGGQGAIQVQWVGGPINERTDLGAPNAVRPPLRECRR